MHTHCFTLQKCILSFIQRIRYHRWFVAHKSFANCLAAPHLVSSLPTHLSAFRTTYNSFLSNSVVTKKSPLSENKCVQSGDTLPFSSFPMAGAHLAPNITPSRWWPLLCSCFRISLPRHQVPVFRWVSAHRKIAGWVCHLLCSLQLGLRPEKREEAGRDRVVWK